MQDLQAHSTMWLKAISWLFHHGAILINVLLTQEEIDKNG